MSPMERQNSADRYSELSDKKDKGVQDKDSLIANAKALAELHRIPETIKDPFGNNCYLTQVFSNAGLYQNPETGKTRIVQLHSLNKNNE